MKEDYKITEQEWIVSDRWNDFELKVVSKDGKRICEVKSFTSDEFNDPTTYEADQNANLIAAAPQLLEALQYLLNQIPKDLKTDWLFGECETANKAIEKALGI